MRTRSQPASPGGLVSLDDIQRATRRATRSARSASRGASQEPSSQQSSSQQPTEPATQPTTHPKSQQRTAKKTTTKKTTSTTSTTKSQTHRGSKRGTRSTARKANQATSEEAHDSIDENHLDTARADNEDNAEVGTEEAESGPSTSDAVLLEPKNSEREYHTSLSPSQIPLPLSIPPSPSPLLSQYLSNPLEFPEFQESQDPEGCPNRLLDNITGSHENDSGWEQFRALQESIVPMEPSSLDGFDEFHLSFPAFPDVGETSVLGQGAKNLNAMTPTENQPNPSTIEQVDAAEPTAGEPKETEQSNDSLAACDEPANRKETVTPLASSVDSEEQTAMEDNSVNELAEIFAKLSFSKTVVSHKVAVSSMESTTVPATLPELKPMSVITPVITGNTVSDIANDRQPAPVLSTPVAATSSAASIYDVASPSIPVMGLLVSERRVQQLTLFPGGIPESPSSIFEDGQTPRSLDITEKQQGVEEPLAAVVLEEKPGLIAGSPLRSSRAKFSEQPVSGANRRRQLRGWPDTPLSPIPEERDLDPPPSSSVGPEEAIPSDTTPAKCSAPSTRIVTLVTPPPCVSITVQLIHPEPPPPPLTTSKGSPKPPSKSESSFKGTPKTSKTPKILKLPGNQMTPKTPTTPKTQDCSDKAKPQKKLTKNAVNRKRSRTETSPDNDAEPVTPHTNKRRNLGPPGSTPFARRHTNLTRRLSKAAPFIERQRRRTAESQGRIHSTIFRLPQLVAQTEADRRTSETTALSTHSREPLQTNLDLSFDHVQTDAQAVPEEKPAIAQEPSTPEPARRGWNISGLFNSVPRSVSRFLPRFGRSPARSEVSAIQQPASERIQRTQPPEAPPVAAPVEESQSRRRLSEQPPAKRPRNLSYSLFPAPIDRTLYLGDVPTKSPATATDSAHAPAPALQPVQQDVPQRIEPQSSITPTERCRDSTPQPDNTTSESQKKKRKRSPSPDVIPNPAGASYGMDLDYFYYSSDSEDDVAESPAPQTEPRKTGTLAKTALQSVVQSERPASKKVRFDASPEDTPSKRRARATDPYNGRHFVGMGSPQTYSAPTTPTPSPAPVIDPRQRPGFIPNRTGTFELDYDAFSDDTDSSGAASPNVLTPSAATRTSTSTQPETQSDQSPAPSSATRPAQPPSTPAKIDEEALARARSQAEKYKPKTPSGLRTASRYSSPLTAATPDLTPAPLAEKIVENISEKFGDDQFAKDAQWLYENCPSGDLRQLAWPAKQPFGQGLNVSSNSLRILNEIWDPAEIDNAYSVFQREYADFKKTIA